MKIGFFGCGNMGTAIAEGFKKNYPENSGLELYFFTPSKTKAKDLADRLGGHFVSFAVDMPKDLDWYILAFKPQSLMDFNFAFNSNAKVLSVLAGTGIEALEKKFQINHVARLMPNTPSSIGFGANLFYANFDSEDMKKLLAALGKLFTMKSEKEMDIITSFSGSGPALVFEYARLFEKHLIALNAGASNDAREIIAQTFLGSAKLMEKAVQENISFETLREQVTSKKGVTFEALQIMEKNGLDHIMGGAFTAAYKRTLEIKKGI
ncbi:MAG: pyrroline-5-carboxylate reductase [Rhizobacter sp.]|nr:pyrroline-5-carboxylate reductase [Bacteriovorax sp.]